MRRRIAAQVLHHAHRISRAAARRAAGAKGHADILGVQGKQLLGRAHQLFLRRNIAGRKKLQTERLFATHSKTP
jgi:hypothetical protein